MKLESLFFFLRRNVVLGLLPAVALLAASPVSAQNFVKNPDFEEPLGPDNWTLVYAPVINSGLANANGTMAGPADFLVAGRTTMSHKDLVPGTWDGGSSANYYTNYWSKFGLNFAPNHTWVMHAYFKQVISGLQPAANYACSAWIAQNNKNGDHTDAAQVYMETLGGPTLNVSKRTAYVTDSFQNNPPGWKRYTVTNSASISGQIEIQLHYNKMMNVGSQNNNYWEYRNQNACFDHVAVVRAGQPDTMPPYHITSFMRANQEVMLQWKTVMNNRYRIQLSQNISDPNSWAMLERELNVETNFFATGTNFMFKTNLAALFYYNPPPAPKVPNYLDPNAPVFFRIYTEPFVP